MACGTPSAVFHKARTLYHHVASGFVRSDGDVGVMGAFFKAQEILSACAIDGVPLDAALTDALLRLGLAAEAAMARQRGTGDQRLPGANALKPDNCAADSARSAPLDGAWHNADFTEVNWFGNRYTFDIGNQAKSVRLLWREWERHRAGLHEQTIGEKIGSKNLSQVASRHFRRHQSRAQASWMSAR